MKGVRFRVPALVLLAFAPAFAQQTSQHILTADELKKAVPAEYFFRGQKAPVQLRNALGFQLADDKMALAARRTTTAPLVNYNVY